MIHGETFVSLLSLPDGTGCVCILCGQANISHLWTSQFQYAK